VLVSTLATDGTLTGIKRSSSLPQTDVPTTCTILGHLCGVMGQCHGNIVCVALPPPLACGPTKVNVIRPGLALPDCAVLGVLSSPPASPPARLLADSMPA
jgi:hypothetical protein